MKVKNLNKLPKRKVTVDDLLDCEDIDAVLVDMKEVRNDTKELLSIAVLLDDTIMWRHSDISVSRMIYLMEVVKNQLLNNE